MPTVSNGATRTRESDLLKGYNSFEDEAYVDYCFATVDVKAASETDIDNIGIPMKWNSTTSAFNVFTANSDWVKETAYSVGDVVKPVTQDGYEYMCMTAGTSHTSEPTWITVIGGTTTETTGVVWVCRRAYMGDGGPAATAGSEICIAVGAAEGRGFNQTDTTIDTDAVDMTVIYRGPAAVVEDGFTWGDVAEADQDEFYAALDRKGISVIESGTTVAPTFV
jgi:hypothetical protein